MWKIYLRALEPEDYHTTVRWRNEKRIRDGVISTPYYISSAMEKEWFARHAGYDPLNIRLAICEKKTKKHVGNIYLLNIDYVSRKASNGILLGNLSSWGKGYASEAARELFCYAFDDLGLNKIYCHVLADNAESLRLTEKLGFDKEGVLKEHVYKNGRYKDLVCLGLFKNKWNSDSHQKRLRDKRGTDVNK